MRAAAGSPCPNTPQVGIGGARDTAGLGRVANEVIADIMYAGCSGALNGLEIRGGRAALEYTTSDRVVFDIDLPTLNKSNVKLAASVLRLAKNIRE
jgi:hypothetical protein